MSIAASVLIRPSRVLRILSASLGTVLLLLCGRLSFKEFSVLPHSINVALTIALALLALFLFYSSFRTRKSFQLDISGLGGMRLREHYTRAGKGSWESSPIPDEAGADAVRLLPDSTIWPGLLALHLRRPDGRKIRLLVLPDMIEASAFRPLRVALRWIATQEEQLAREDPILPH